MSSVLYRMWSVDGRTHVVQVFQAEALRHPAAALGLPSGGSFVPNDVHLGGQSPPFLVLTGPNMGGKSTLLRQVSLVWRSWQAQCPLDCV